MYKFLNIHNNELHPVFKLELTKLFTEKVDRYSPSITFLTLNQKRKFEKYCRSNIIHKSYKLNVSYKFIYNTTNKFPFLLYLTTSKGKENIEAINNRKKLHTIVFSGSHFNKVCRATIENNYKFEVVLSDIKLYDNENEIPPKNYSITMHSNFKWGNITKKQDEKIVNIADKDDLKHAIKNIPLPNKNIPKELIPPKTPQPPKPPKIEKIISSSSQPSKSSIIDNIISNKENKKKLEKSLKIIKSLI